MELITCDIRLFVFPDGDLSILATVHRPKPLKARLSHLLAPEFTINHHCQLWLQPYSLRLLRVSHK